MKALDVRTLVHLPPEPVYEFLLDFPGYGDYSEYLTEIDQVGNGGAGTVYEFTVSWWLLTHTVRSEVTGLAPPERIEWAVADVVDAHGAWHLEPATAHAPSDVEAATEVTLAVRYDPASVSEGTLDLPVPVSLDGLIERVRPTLEAEAEAVVERVVADLEGAARDVDLEVSTPRES